MTPSEGIPRICPGRPPQKKCACGGGTLVAAVRWWRRYAGGGSMLAHRAPDAVLYFAIAASDLHVLGASYSNCPGAAGAAQKLSGPGSSYSTFDRELLATFSAILHFRFRLEGWSFRL